MEESDYSDKVNTDPGFIADRQAIVNHVTAYAYLLDEGRWGQWFDLFTDDVVFETTTPCFGTIIAQGKAAFPGRGRSALSGPGSKKNTTVRRHTMGNIHVARQTRDSADVRTYMLISTAPEPGKGAFQVLTSGTYNASLKKIDGRWKITRWYIEVDAPPQGLRHAEGRCQQGHHLHPRQSPGLPQINGDTVGTT